MKKLVRYSGIILGAALTSIFLAVANADAASSGLASGAGHGLTLAEAQKFVSGFSSSVDGASKTASLKGSIAKDCVQHFKLENDARVAEDNWVRFSLTDMSGEGLRCLEIYRDVCPGDKCVSFDALSNDPKTNTKFRSSVPLLDSELTRAKVGLVASLSTTPPPAERKPEIKTENLEAAGACAQCKPAMGKTSLDESTKPMTDIVARGLHGFSKSKKMRDRDDADDNDEDDDRPSRKKMAKKSRSKSRDRDADDDDDDDDDSSSRIVKRKKSSSDRYELVDQSAYRQKIQSIMFQGQGQGLNGQGMGMRMTLGASGVNSGLGYESVLSNAYASPYASQYSSMAGMGQSAMMGMDQQPSSMLGNPYALLGYGQPANLNMGGQMGYGNQLSAFGNPYALTTPNSTQYGSAFSSPFSSPSVYSMIPNNYGTSFGLNIGANYGLSNMSAFFGRGY